MSQRAAVVIAVENFFELGPPLPYATSDAAELLRTLPGAGYNPAKCLLLTSTRTTKAVIESHLQRLPKLLGPVDALLVFIATRGFHLKTKTSYLVCADTIPSDPAATAMTVAEVVAAVRRVRCPEVTFLFDVESLPALAEAPELKPGLVGSELEALFTGKYPSACLLSCQPGERSFESGQLRRGIWRHHVIQALAGQCGRRRRADSTLTAAALHDYLTEAVPRTLRHSYETPPEQTPRLLGETFSAAVIADFRQQRSTAAEGLDTARLKRVVLRAESHGRVKELAGFRKTHTLPERANEWARKFVHRIGAADIQADVDATFARLREAFGYRRKELDVSTDRAGVGFIRTPDFEYTVSLDLNPEQPSAVIWRRELARMASLELFHSPPFRTVFGSLFDQLVFEFAVPVDVAEWVDRIEEQPLAGVNVRVASDAGTAIITLAGFRGQLHLTRHAVTIHGRAGDPASLLEQFLVFLRKFRGIGEPAMLPPG
ncbi:MAG: caspase family protein [Gemmataceae bacterium]|nr:caspase family protein [Gemmata sp.]MDW8196873.1 caspase family protein [Gemmataceae bacterium]